MTEQSKTDPADEAPPALAQERQISETQEERIRRLNDELRNGASPGGTIVITSGIQAGGPDFVDEAMKVVAAFDAFDEDNDPWQEHDFGALDVRGQRVFFKIDLYEDNPVNREMGFQGETRVLTIMLAHEY